MLSGIKIVEFEALGPAPFAGMLLADLGAEVTVIHRKGAAETPGKEERNLLDRGKRSIALDLKDGGDVQVAKALVAQADGLTEGMRPGVMERLGFGPDEMLAMNPVLVYGRMTGWGQDGPRAKQAGHDLNYLSLSGALFYGGVAGDAPGVPPTMLGDIGGGAMYLAVGMLAGLLRAREIGRGSVVDAAIVDGTSHMMALLLSMGDQFSTTSRGASLLDGPHWSRCYACSCGGHVSVQCLEPKFYGMFLEAMGLTGDPGFAAQFDAEQWPVQTARLAGMFAGKPRAHWAEIFANSDACVAPVLSPEEARSDPHVAARGIWTARGPAPAPRFDCMPLQEPSPSPARGQHSGEILKDLEDRGLI